MPRSARIDIANALHHVTQRGLERRKIVLCDEDRGHWWRLFDRVAVRCRWRVFAVVLLDNHFHIFLRTPMPNLSDGMRDLDGGYGSIFNQLHGREGPLYQGRFKSVLVEDQGHAWELSRYVHLNPFRAKLTVDPFQYHWSSCHYFLNSRQAPEWLDWRSVLAEFGGTEGAARIAYKRYIESGMANPPLSPLVNAESNGIFGSKEFVERWKNELEKVARLIPVGLTVIESVCLEFGVEFQSLVSRGRHNHVVRDAAVMLAREFCSEPLATLAVRFGNVSRSAISEIDKRARIREQTDDEFGRRLEAVRRRLAR